MKVTIRTLETRRLEVVFNHGKVKVWGFAQHTIDEWHCRKIEFVKVFSNPPTING
jgi:hypothetical protein